MFYINPAHFQTVSDSVISLLRIYLTSLSMSKKISNVSSKWPYTAQPCLLSVNFEWTSVILKNILKKSLGSYSTLTRFISFTLWGTSSSSSQQDIDWNLNSLGKYIPLQEHWSPAWCLVGLGAGKGRLIQHLIVL